MTKKVVLVVLDGFGERPQRDDNAIRMAKTPTLDALYREYPHTLLDASGRAVGLPDGQMGNSEVGHLNLGSGRVVYQDLTRIDHAIETGTFHDNAELAAAVEAAKASGGALHLMGLTSPGGVHSSLEHAYALVELAKRRGLDRVYWHAFTDGRDTPPKSAAGYLRDVVARLRTIGVGRVASVVGRFYAMDRDTRWERVELAYRLLTEAAGERERDVGEAIEARYAQGETDEFLKPMVLVGSDGQGAAPLRDGDAVVFFNFRADRARELTAALTADAFDGFSRAVRPKLSRYVCMTEYDVRFDLPVAFPPQSPRNILGEVLSQRGLRQLRTAETEKYAHVTFFFNGGVEAPFPGEERRLVPSPKEVATYDLKPSMSLPAVADGVVEAIVAGGHDFILVNFANPDMVGHTGLLAPAIEAIEAVDESLGRVIKAARAQGMAVMITADHGNCETMVDENGEPHTAHTTNLVPFLLVDDSRRSAALRAGGRLCDVAPTVLQVMGLSPQPVEMDGRSLLTP
jgi:2,3-bisphosphoglycerate-independent phosphoglycerate mutase